MLEVLNIGCKRGPRILFEDLSLAAVAGSIVWVKGANGSGKTSLLRILCGLLPPTQGRLLWNGQPLAHAREEYHRDLTYIGHANGLKDDLTALENLAFGCELTGQAADAAAIAGALRRFEVSHCAALPVRHLSQGQRRRVALSRLAFGRKAPLWILDEPFNALDATAVDCLRSLIDVHARSGGSVILTSHFTVAFDTAVTTVDLDCGIRRA